MIFVQAISRTKILERLSIYNNNITSVGCAALTAAVAANPNLKLVEFLPGNAAHTKDIKALARAVKQNRKYGAACVMNLLASMRYRIQALVPYSMVSLARISCDSMCCELLGPILQAVQQYNQVGCAAVLVIKHVTV